MTPTTGRRVRRGRLAASVVITGALLLSLLGCLTRQPPRLEPTEPRTASTTPVTGKMTITVVYDNNEFDPRLRTDWGFSCLVRLDETTLLFDTGGDGGILLSNMSKLGLDPQNIDHVVLSHIHGDHTGGLASLLATGAEPVVWAPQSFPQALLERVRSSGTELRLVNGPTTIVEGVHSTGELGSGIIEHALVLSRTDGLVVITGCAHPGIVGMLDRVRELHESEILLVVGGLHLSGKSTEELEHVADQLYELGAQELAPCHCTGDEAMHLFAEVWGDKYIRNGVGKVIELEK